MIRAAGKEGYYRENIKEQKEFEHGEYFQRVLLEFFNSCIRNDINKHGYILESVESLQGHAVSDKEGLWGNVQEGSQWDLLRRAVQGSGVYTALCKADRTAAEE